MKVLSIDPAWDKPYAVATFQDGIYQDCSLVEINNIGWALSRWMTKKEEMMVVVEEAYIGVHKKGARNICYAVGGVISICKYFQINYEIMSIKKWKAEHKLEQLTDKMRLVVMKHLVRKITHHEIDSIDKQCAILIGQAWINKNEKSTI